MHYHHGPYTDSVLSSPPASTVAAMPSSPAGPFMSPSRTGRRKERRHPSVTPRRFGRFFTPRSSLPAGPALRKPLERLDPAAISRQPISPQSLASDPITSDPMCSSPTERVTRASDAAKRRCMETPMQALKKRRGYVMEDVSLPPLTIPNEFQPEETDVVKSAHTQDASWLSRQGQDALADKRKATLNLFFKASRSGGLRGLQEKSLPNTPDVFTPDVKAHSTLEGYQPQPIRKFRNRGFESQSLNREHGLSRQAGERHLATPACDPRTETASFYSSSKDIHNCVSYTGQGNTIPFSLASCHNAPVTAIGDEQGYVRLFNTTESSEMADAKVDIHISAHDNAIMDLAFSQDDMRLATACGDRTGKIIDVATQTTAFELAGGHCDSLRQIAFQAGQANGSTLATSDRAGRIQVWDLRCSPMPVNCFSTVTSGGGVIHRNTDMETMFSKTVNTIDNAHERTVNGSTTSASVTAIQWMPAGREHLLLSASEANACIKLWDTRYIKPRRQATEIPLAVTPEPRSHAWRSYGMTSMALSADAARLYAVCKDSTVYAYSTSHLILGHAPELENNATKRKPSGVEALGPLFGFKHDLFRAQSFYVKCAIRPSLVTGGPELLAVGSTDSCAVLFPTDERYMRTAWSQRSHILDNNPSLTSTSSSFSSAPPPPPTPAQTSTNPFFAFSCSTPSAAPGASGGSSIPIFRSGTALVRGHSREVTTLSWSHEGKLVTASDDYVVRQWQRDDAAARHLRTVGEFGGERHMAGWADVGADWDIDEE